MRTATSRVLVSLLTACAVGGSGLLSQGAAWAELSPQSSVAASSSPSATASPSASATATQDADAEADRSFVSWIAAHDPRAAVRSAAQDALDAGVAVALRRFAELRYAPAAETAATATELHAAQLAWVVARYPSARWPHVAAAAQTAQAGDDTAQSQFLASGLLEAVRADLAARAATLGSQSAEVEAADLKYVQSLTSGPGAAVSVLAGYAVTDSAHNAAAVPEFLTATWPDAARRDHDSFHVAAVDSDDLTMTKVAAVVTYAERVQKQFAGQANPPAASVQAVREAWQSVADQAQSQVRAWTEDRATALAQAEAWQRTVTAAAATASRNWDVIAPYAAVLAAEWAADADQAASRAATWAAVAARASAIQAALPS